MFRLSLSALSVQSISKIHVDFFFFFFALASFRLLLSVHFKEFIYFILSGIHEMCFLSGTLSN